MKIWKFVCLIIVSTPPFLKEHKNLIVIVVVKFSFLFSLLRGKREMKSLCGFSRTAKHCKQNTPKAERDTKFKSDCISLDHKKNNANNRVTLVFIIYLFSLSLTDNAKKKLIIYLNNL